MSALSRSATCRRWPRPPERVLILGALLLGLALMPRTSARAQQPAPPPEMLALDSLLATRISAGAKYAQTTTETAASVSIITSDDIERYGYRTLDEALASLPGFYTSYDRNYTYVGNRGFSRPTDYNNRLLVLIDGNTMNEDIFGSALVGNELGLPLRSLERIEVVRGPGSALYGTGAVFGVVNLVTKTPAVIDGAEVGVQGGSYGRRGANLLYGKRLGTDAGVSLTGFWNQSDGHDLFFAEYDSPDSDNGIAQDLDWEDWWGLQGKATKGGLMLQGRYASRSKGIPTAPYGMPFNQDSARTWDAFGFLEVKYERDLDVKRSLAARVYYNGYWYDGDYPTEDGLDTDAGRNHAVGAETTLRWDIASGNRLTMGGEVRRALDARYFAPRSSPFDQNFNLPNTVASAYVQDEHQLTRSVSVLAGVRYDGHATSGSSVTPRGAVIMTPAHGTTLKLLYGEAFRAPNVYEAGVSAGGYKLNPDLASERARTLELVWNQRLAAGLMGTVSVFDYHLRDLIDLTVDPTDDLLQYRNVGTAQSNGVEVGLEARLGGVGSYASYSFQRTVTEGTSVRLTNSPAHLVKAGANVAATSWLYPALQVRYESSRRTVYGTETDPYFLTDVNFVLVPDSRGLQSDRLHLTRWELAIRVSNLFGASYATPGGVEHRQAAISQDGRTIGADLRYRF